ncbi:hypothetical protein HGG76_21090 [Ochrobactrum tritici]|uniref:Uncharacterized protein n=1 Tax=Brucella tritici TaxID=94626 RepID=A0A7X6FRP8_9HYPH|nr:hypothetical protein [Brucella tritici]
MKAGTKLNIITTALEPGQPVAFKVSLKGFGSALSRIAELKIGVDRKHSIRSPNRQITVNGKDEALRSSGTRDSIRTLLVWRRPI